MIVVSFFTNEKYGRHAVEMSKSAARVGLERVHVYHREDLGTHVRNVSHKPKVILQALQEHRQDVLFVDADTRFHQHPTLLFQTDAEFACYFHRKDYCWAGTIWVKYPHGRRYVEAWQEACDSGAYRLTRYALYPALQTIPDRRVLHLPPSYSWAPIMMRSRFPGARPVIEDLLTDMNVPEQRDDYGKEAK